jgi:N-acyl-D-aspartate/D-glutamate deacylase
LASWEEVKRLVGVLGRLGTGVFELAGETVSPGTAEFLDSRGRMFDLAVTTGVPITRGVLGTEPLDFLDTICRAGGRAFGQANCRGVMSILGFEVRLPFDVLPEWKRIRSLPLGEQAHILSDPEQRKQLADAARIGPYDMTIGAEARPPDYEAMYLFDRGVPPYRSVADVARERRCDPVDLVIDLSLASDFHQLFIQPLTPADPDTLLATMKHPRAIMTFSDSGAHVGQISDCSIHTHLLAHWVRDRQEFTLEQAVRMLTRDPARAWGLVDRGVLREGCVADLAVFDPKTVAPELPVVTADLPAGAVRLTQKASGFLAMVVGGKVSLRDGEATGALPGELLRGPFLRS